ncbi:MAG: hypothetical protein Ct9H300mP13_4150 [Gammaproteobacteria bacterium]|nr:MAG: hypothetical protein Ct9H300mP13_4150 [Gammaproteobacteria bacterium]
MKCGGQTEFNYAVGNSSSMMSIVPGAMGKNPIRAIRLSLWIRLANRWQMARLESCGGWRDDPVMFLGYWKTRGSH